eukprot:281032_1
MAVQQSKHSVMISFDDDEIYHDIFPQMHIDTTTGKTLNLPPLPDLANEDEWFEEEEEWSDHSTDSDDSIQKVVMDALLRNITDQEKVQIRARKRKRAIEELLSTERTYVDLMTKLMNHYVTKLKTKKKNCIIG